MCKKLLPVARSFARREERTLELVLVGDGGRDEHEALIREHKLDGVPFLLSPVVGMTYGIGKLPYAVLIDHEGILRSKGLVNSREHLESLLTAKEIGHASIQDYLTAAEGETRRTPGPGACGNSRGEDNRMRTSRFDRLIERASRRIAQTSSRRSFLARLGVALAGGAVLPILPVDRTGRLKTRSCPGVREDGPDHRPDGVQLLALLCGRRLHVRLLRRHLQQMSAGFPGVTDLMGGELHQSGRWTGLT